VLIINIFKRFVVVLSATDPYRRGRRCVSRATCETGFATYEARPFLPRNGVYFCLSFYYIPQIPSMAKEAVLETMQMSYGDDGILRIRIKEGAVIGLAQIRLQSEMIQRLCGDAKIPVLIDASLSHTVTKEAQEYGAHSVGNRVATAVVNPNPFSKIGFNLYLRIFRPSTPYRIFTSEENAEKWLREQRAARG
jgi:hypothetical protein